MVMFMGCPYPRRHPRGKPLEQPDKTRVIYKQYLAGGGDWRRLTAAVAGADSEVVAGDGAEALPALPQLQSRN